MAKIVQLNIFGEAEPVEVAPRGYDAFVAKFKRKKLFTIVIKYIAPICIILILISSVLDALGIVKI